MGAASAAGEAWEPHARAQPESSKSAPSHRHAKRSRRRRERASSLLPILGGLDGAEVDLEPEPDQARRQIFCGELFAGVSEIA